MVEAAFEKVAELMSSCDVMRECKVGKYVVEDVEK
jgi:hypothetical protein